MLENAYAWKVMLLVVVCVVAYVLQHAASDALYRAFKTSNVPRGSIFVNIVRVIIWSIAVLGVLEPVFGVQPTAFIAALGVTSVAISFGLQTTISNVISGVGLMIAHVFEVGDWIEVGGYQGLVVDMTWRATTIKALIGDIIVIPNSVLNSTTLRKLAPLSSRAVTIPIAISPDADMAEVERDIMESVGEATETWRDPDLPIDLIAQGYDSFHFRMDVRVPLRTIDDGLFARRAIMGACAGKAWLARWQGEALGGGVPGGSGSSV